jgi:hypothetical protein
MKCKTGRPDRMLVACRRNQHGRAPDRHQYNECCPSLNVGIYPRASTAFSMDRGLPKHFIASKAARKRGAFRKMGQHDNHSQHNAHLYRHIVQTVNSYVLLEFYRGVLTYIGGNGYEGFDHWESGAM